MENLLQALSTNKNRIQIRYGMNTPQSEHLRPFELGYCIKDESLYIGHPIIEEEYIKEDGSNILSIGGFNNINFDINKNWFWKNRLIEEGKEKDDIIVGIYNTDQTSPLNIEKGLYINGTVTAEKQIRTKKIDSDVAKINNSIILDGSFDCDLSNGIILRALGGE